MGCCRCLISLSPGYSKAARGVPILFTLLLGKLLGLLQNGPHKPTNIVYTEVDTLSLAVTQLTTWQVLPGRASPESAWEPLCSLVLHTQASLPSRANAYWPFRCFCSFPWEGLLSLHPSLCYSCVLLGFLAPSGCFSSCLQDQNVSSSKSGDALFTCVSPEFS